MKHIKIFSLLFPIVVLLGFVGLHTVNQKTGTSWVVDIEGYDPRDLLRGHYLTYRYVWNWGENHSNCVGENCCMCINQAEANDNKNPVVAVMECEQAHQAGQCMSAIKGRGFARPAVTGVMTRPSQSFAPQFHIGHRKDSGLTKYYIPEKYAKKLDRMLRGRDEEHSFAIGLRVNEVGVAFIETMYINGKPLNQWLDEYEADQGE